MDDKLFCFESGFDKLDDPIHVCSVDNDLDHAGFVVVRKGDM